eukprot:3935407-Rhodomonas_salina.9
MEEGQQITVSGVNIMDVDLDEVPCKDGICEPRPGVMKVVMHAQNGTFLLPPTWETLNLVNLKRQMYAGRKGYEDETIQSCLWKKWCDDLESDLGQPTIGISRASPCAELPLYHTVQECVDLKIPFCSVARTILPASYTMEWCQEQIEFAEFLNNQILLSNEEIGALKDFQQRLMNNARRQNERRNLLVMVGKMEPIRAAFTKNFFTYRPDDFYNGMEEVLIELNDLARKGIRYELPSGPEINAFRVPRHTWVSCSTQAQFERVASVLQNLIFAHRACWVFAIAEHNPHHHDDDHVWLMFGSWSTATRRLPTPREPDGRF